MPKQLSSPALKRTKTDLKLFLSVFFSSSASPIPFDFLINSSLLRSSLGAYCEASGTSEEVTLEIEYLPSTLPPQLESTLPSEDWVSDVSVGLRGCVSNGLGLEFHGIKAHAHFPPLFS